MKLTRIGFKDDEITLAWVERPMEKSPDTVVESGMKSPDAPSPEFREAMSALVAPTLKLLELPKAYTEGAVFRGLTLRDDDKVQGYVVKLLKPIKATNAPLALNTPFLRVSVEDEEGGPIGIPDELQDAVAELVKRATRYAKGFERENVDLFEGEEAA